jgi:hypothetical protein
MRNSWENHGKIMVKREDHGKIMGKYRTSSMKIMEHDEK